MFTRLTDTIVDQMKKDKGLEFVWRASSALPAHQSEIFAHVFESCVICAGCVVVPLLVPLLLPLPRSQLLPLLYPSLTLLVSFLLPRLVCVLSF